MRTDNERHLTNLLDWRTKERDEARTELRRLEEQLHSAETTLAHAEAFIEHQNMSYRWAEWCDGRDPETPTPAKRLT